ncbi:peroxidase-related enzyme [Solwaraspora sp. WMMD406]|uniref:carboxymuconolactone decarboxylase family protein n=1 Tax=Solwaraspora sp. WMMD406 TaxID=3016095 RepID=UPI00241737C1|nr:peroxidase-related enzyme [Solwaraspora sp. WMMD406]MDG4767936.1 peroxidase-related enzyme [Solwaraspora sp. WMMD406]
MAHIELGVDEQEFPGIIGPMRFRPETARPLNELAEVLLRRTPHPLTPGERELIAAYVSRLNQCTFCCSSHSAFAAVQLDEGAALVDQVLADPDTASVSNKLRALLRIAAAVQQDGRSVTSGLVAAARAAGATDLEVHDTVLIAAAFCMFNRYVDGLDTYAPDSPDSYLAQAHQIVHEGYGTAAGTPVGGPSAGAGSVSGPVSAQQ